MSGNFDSGPDVNNITQFLEDFEARRTGHNTTFQQPHRRVWYSPSLQLSDAERSRPRSLAVYPTPSHWSNETPLTATEFERFDEESRYTMSSAPSLRGPEPLHLQRPPIPLFGAALSEQAPSEIQLSSLPCEFLWYTDCEETFELDQDAAWVEHMVSQHLGGMLPQYCICWFCDDTNFEAKSVQYEDTRANLSARIRHIAGHFGEGQTITRIRPDFFFLDHIYGHGLISKGVFQSIKEYHEAPQPRYGINPVPPTRHRDWHGAQDVVVEVRSRRRGRPESQRSYRHAPSHFYLLSLCLAPFCEGFPGVWRLVQTNFEQKNRLPIKCTSSNPLAE